MRKLLVVAFLFACGSEPPVVIVQPSVCVVNVEGDAPDAGSPDAGPDCALTHQCFDCATGQCLHDGCATVGDFCR